MIAMQPVEKEKMAGEKDVLWKIEKNAGGSRICLKLFLKINIDNFQASIEVC